MIADDAFSTYYAPYLDDSYDVVDRIALNARYQFACSPGGFRQWWFDRYGTFENLNDTFLMRQAGRFSRRVRGWAKHHNVPFVDVPAHTRKDQLIKQYFPTTSNAAGVFAIFTSRRPSPVWQVLRCESNPTSFHLQRKKLMPWVKHYHFHIMDKTWGHIIVSMSGHPPFNALIILNGHEYTACQARRKHIQFRKEDNCFTLLSDSRGLSDVAESLRQPAAIGQLRQVCDRWTRWCASFGISFAEQEHTRFRYDYSVFELEFCRNILFHRGQDMEQVFDGVIDRTRSMLDVKRVMKIFGHRRRRTIFSRAFSREQVVLEKPTHDLTVFKLHYLGVTLKMYTKGERVLRAEVMAEKIDRLNCGRALEKFQEMVQALADLLKKFLDNLQCVDMPWIAKDQLDTLAQSGSVGQAKTAGLDIDRPRVRAAIHGVLALSLKPGGFTAADHAAKVNDVTGGALNYTTRQAAYDLRKIRGKGLLVKTSPISRRYQTEPDALRMMTGLVVLRRKVIEPLLKYLGRAKSGTVPRETVKLDQYFRNMQHVMSKVFMELHLMGEYSLTKVMTLRPTRRERQSERRQHERLLE